MMKDRKKNKNNTGNMKGIKSLPLGKKANVDNMKKKRNKMNTLREKKK